MDRCLRLHCSCLVSAALRLQGRKLHLIILGVPENACSIMPTHMTLTVCNRGVLSGWCSFLCFVECARLPPRRTCPDTAVRLALRPGEAASFDLRACRCGQQCSSCPILDLSACEWLVSARVVSMGPA